MHIDELAEYAPGISCRRRAPTIWFLIVFRVVKGYSCGFAAVVARTVVVDVARANCWQG